MADVFGSPAGEIAYDSTQLTRAKTAETLGDIAMQPARKRLINAQAEKFEIESAQEKAFSDLMKLNGGVQGTPTGRPTSMADQLDSLARTAAGAGLVVKASTLAKDAALIRTREATQRKAQTDEAKAQIQVIREDAELSGQLFGGAVDQESWNRANALYTFQTGRPSPYQGMPYSPELVGQIEDSALSAKNRADLLERQLVRRNTAAYRKSRLDQIDTQNGLRKRQADLAEEREKRLGKAGGGKAVTSPAKGELDQAARLIGGDYGNMDAKDKNDAAYSIAAEARALRRANPALDANTALQQAFQNAKAAGDFGEDSGFAGTGIKKKATFTGRGRTATLPAPIPADKKQLKADRYYVNSLGQVGKWTGKGFVISRSLSGDNGRPDIDLESEDDDEDLE